MKRTISMILVAVMLVLSLVSCAYSIADEDISLYATLSQEDKTKFETALKSLLIEDGDLTTDPETRNNKVEDALYTALASTVSSDDKVTEGVPGAHDVVYYSYYCTAEFDGETVVLYASNMKSSASVQLGLKEPTDLQEKLIGVFSGVDFKDITYEASTSGTAAKGDVAFVTYTYSYTKTTEGGTESTVTKTVTNDIVVIGELEKDATATTLEDQLFGKNVNSTIANFELEDEELGKVKYTSVKINWIAKGDKLASFKDVTYDEKTTQTDTKGVSRNLKDVELTYHVYPAGFASIPEYNAKAVINDILSTDVTADIFYEVVFGRDFIGKGEEEDKYTDEQKNEILDKYKDIAYDQLVEKVDENKNKTYEKTSKTAATLAELIEALKTVQTNYKSAESSLETANKELDKAKNTFETAQTSLKSAKEAYDAKVEKDGAENATNEKNALDKAQAAYESAKEALEGTKNAEGALVGGARNAAKKAEDAAKRATDNRDFVINALFALDEGVMEEKIANGYKKSTELYLIDVYDNEIKMNVAKEVYYFLRQNVKISSYPEDAINETYEQLFENYEYSFYNEDFGDTKESNYKHYNKDFKKYFIETVVADLKVTAETYEQAKTALRENAKTYVEPILVIYAAAQAYDAVLTEEEYEEYKEELGASYENNLSAYGDNSFRYACQFDKLMNKLLEDGDTAPDADGSVSYNELITYTFGTPASSVEDTDDGEEDDKDDDGHGHDH